MIDYPDWFGPALHDLNMRYGAALNNPTKEDLQYFYDLSGKSTGDDFNEYLRSEAQKLYGYLSAFRPDLAPSTMPKTLKGFVPTTQSNPTISGATGFPGIKQPKSLPPPSAVTPQVNKPPAVNTANLTQAYQNQNQAVSNPAIQLPQQFQQNFNATPGITPPGSPQAIKMPNFNRNAGVGTNWSDLFSVANNRYTR